MEAPQTSGAASPGHRRKRRPIMLARIAHIAALLLACSIAALFVAALTRYYHLLATVCTVPPCLAQQLTPPQVLSLAAAGLTPMHYAAAMSAAAAGFAIVWWGTGMVLLWRKPLDPMALTVATALIILGCAIRGVFDALSFFVPEWDLPLRLLGLAGFIALILFLYTFPTGHFTPRWTVALAALWIANVTFSLLLPTDTGDSWGGPLGVLGFILFLVPALGGIWVQRYRYKHESTAEQRRQTRWMVWGVSVGLGWFIAGSLLQSLGPPLQEPGSPSGLVADIVTLAGLLVIPVALALAIVRHQLFDIDLLIQRTLVYSLLTASVTALYVVLVVGLGSLFQLSGSLLLSVLATCFVAVAFQPLRERLQRRVNRLIYGRRDEPYTVLTRLGQHLEATLEPSALLPTTAATIAETLRLPYVAIALSRDRVRVLEVVTGQRRRDGAEQRFPLVYQGQNIGELRVGMRDGESALTPADVRLLTDLCRQIGPAAYSLQLTIALEQARLSMVSERAAARRQLGADLHDGVGHQFTALGRAAETAANLLDVDPAGVRTLLAQIASQSRAASDQVRRLAHQLHPPDLELLGLIEVLRERSLTLSDTLHVHTDLPPSLPPLPLAVETAAYYIAQEALTNVQRHAQARSCWLCLRLEHATRMPNMLLPHVVGSVLVLEVSDDGCGLPGTNAQSAGLGLASMRRRAAEVSGICTATARAGGGTMVRALLPCPPNSEGMNDGADSSIDRR